jgi:glycogen debranching enzyme
MIEFSAALEAKGLPTRVTSSQDVDVLMTAFESHVKSLNLWQYYVLDVEAERKSVKSALEANTLHNWDGVAHKSVVELAEIVRTSGQVTGIGTYQKRFVTRVEGHVSAGIVKAAFVDLQDNEALADAWIRVVDVLNVPLYQEWEEDTKAAIESIRNRLKYTRLDENGPKLGPITKE